MKTLEITRVSTGAVGTFGVAKWSHALAPFCVTLEDPWRENEKYFSCIPAGFYLAKAHKSSRHGDSFWLQDVPSRTEILIHKGNTHEDTQGCILTGEKYSFLRGVPSVSSSGLAFDEMRTVLRDDKEMYVHINWAGFPTSVPR